MKSRMAAPAKDIDSYLAKVPAQARKILEQLRLVSHEGQPLLGDKSYKLHIPANVPAGQFWSVLLYDAMSRSQLRNGEKFPSLSMYTGPKKNADGSIDIFFGPHVPNGEEKNWIKTVTGKGFFPMFRWYAPEKPLYDKTWQLPDVEEVK